MVANINDKFMKLGQRGAKTTLASPGKSPSDTSVTLTNPAEWQTATAITLGLYIEDPDTKQEMPNTYTVWKGILTGSTVSGLTKEYGPDGVTYPAGSIAVMHISSAWANSLVDGILVSHNQDGTLKDSAVATDNIVDANITTTKIADASVTTAKLADAGVTASKIDFTSGIWWEEIGRASLGSNAASLSVTFTPKKYIKVICNGVGVGTSSFGAYVDFNNDTGATNYGRRLIQSTSSSVLAQTNNTRAIFYVTHGFATGGFTFTLEGAGKPVGTSNYFNVQGGTVTELRTGVANWTGAANITTVRIIQDTALAGSLIGAGTEIIVLGHD